MSSVYALRIDCALSEVLAWAAKYEIGGWAVRELATDNEHWHFILYASKTIKQLRCSFNRDCPSLKGNGKYSLTECRDEDKYLRYMAKGSSEGEYPEVVWRHGLEWTEEKVEELHDAYWEANRKLKKRKTGSMIDWLVDECKRAEVHWDNREKIAELYIRELGARGKPINLFAMKANINCVQVQLCPGDDILKVLVERLTQY